MIKKIALLLGALLVAPLAYLGLSPVPVEPVAWQSTPSPGYTGTHTTNKLLAGLTLVSLGAEEGPEHIAIGRDGKLYAAVASGKILRMNLDGTDQAVFAQTGGRVLGFDFDAAGKLVAADAMKGLLSIGPDGKATVLASQHGGAAIGYADAVVVAKSGKVYFSDASTRFAPAQWGGTFEASVLDILEQSCTGRIFEFDPTTRATRIVAQGLCFANGVALSADEQTLFVAETGKYRVWKIAVGASELDVTKTSPQAQILLDNLPGYPDNLMRGLDGRIWLGFAKPRSATVDRLANWPFLRKVTLRLPRSMWPVPKAYGHVIAFTERGRIVADLQDATGAYPETTGITETRERLYVQSLHGKGLAFRPM